MNARDSTSSTVVSAMVVVLLLAFIIDDAAAQTGTRFGVRAGGVLASLSGEVENGEKSMKPGFLAGAFLTYPLTPQFAVQAELHYVTKGVKFSAVDEEVFEGSIEGDLTLNYLEFPLLGRFLLTSPSGNTVPYLLAGIAPSINLIAEGSALGVTVDLQDEVESTDIGIAVGGGVMTSLGLSFDVRYTYGLTNIGSNVAEDGEEAKNRVLSATVAFTFSP